MEELEHERVRRDLHQRHGRRMTEAAVSLLRHAREVALVERARQERPDHLKRDFGVWPAGKAGDGLRIEPRPRLGHVKTAVAGKPREHHLDKVERRGLTPG